MYKKTLIIRVDFKARTKVSSETILNREEDVIAEINQSWEEATKRELKREQDNNKHYINTILCSCNRCESIRKGGAHER